MVAHGQRGVGMVTVWTEKGGSGMVRICSGTGRHISPSYLRLASGLTKMDITLGSEFGTSRVCLLIELWKMR